MGTIPGQTVYLPAFDCPGRHLVTATFTPFPTPGGFAPVPWITLPKLVELEAGQSSPWIDVQLNLGQLQPGKHQGIISLKCVACDQGACAHKAIATAVDVEIPYPTVFGASPADAKFGGLVGGQPVTAQELLPNVLSDIKKSSFASLPGATAIFKTLDEHYLDNNSSDISFIRTIDDTNSKSGRLGVKIVPVDGLSKGPGNGVYSENSLGMEEIYLGVDMSMKGIQAARQNPSDFYVFTIDGNMGVISKADLVHNLVHEGLHATIAGSQDVPQPRGGAAGASIEEEREGFRVGNAAARALGLPEESADPQPSAYNSGSNPAYKPFFPTLVPGAAGAPAKTPAAGSKAATTPAPATTPVPGSSSSSSMVPTYNNAPASGFCANEGSGLACDGAPNFALVCDEATTGGASCTLEGTGLTNPCAFENGHWTCDEMPPAVASCSAASCSYESDIVTDVCRDEGQYVCDQLPAFVLACEPEATCRLEAFPPQETADCLTDDCLTGQVLYAATQNLDCDLAGSGGLQVIKRLGTYDVFPSGRDDDVVGRVRDAFAREADTTNGASLESYKFLLVPQERDFRFDVGPGSDSRNTSVDASAGPLKGSVKVSVESTGIFSYGGATYQLHGASFGSFNFATPSTGLPPGIEPFVSQQLSIDRSNYTTVTFENVYRGIILRGFRDAGITDYQNNGCRKVAVPTDPNYLRTGRNGGNSWGAKEDDQWAIKRVGFTDDADSAWNLVPESAAPTVVAVIDTGLDWHHKDIDANNIWHNADEIPGNGIDDDHNGYVDDVIGWDFLAKSNRPWDFDGHGTVVTGIIAAAHNDAGIAGINPHVKIMVLKGVNNFGTTRASVIAEAIVYAADNAAKVINISVAGPHVSRMEQAAIDYAHKKGALVVAAAGNDGIELDDFGPGGEDDVLTVGATHLDDRAAAFSNYGDRVDIVAPGVDVLSLRARYTDANYRPGGDDEGKYAVGDNYVGPDKRYLHVSGTSFATPIVAGIASLMMSKNPALMADEVRRILLQTAADVDIVGDDKYTGHGMVDARAALSVDKDFSVTAEITNVTFVPADGPQFVRVTGTVDASRFKRAWMQIGPGENPGGWRYVGAKRKFPIIDGTLGTIPIKEFTSSGLWQVVVNVEHNNGVIRRAAFPVEIP